MSNSLLKSPYPYLRHSLKKKNQNHGRLRRSQWTYTGLSSSSFNRQWILGPQSTHLKHSYRLPSSTAPSMSSTCSLLFPPHPVIVSLQEDSPLS